MYSSGATRTMNFETFKCKFIHRKRRIVKFPQTKLS